MKVSSKRIFSIFGAIAMLIATIFVYKSLIQPTYKDIQKKRSEIATLENILEEEQDVVTQIKGVIEQYKGQRQLQEALSLTFPIDKNMPGLVNDISGLARTSGVFVRSLFFKDLPIKKAKNSLANGVGIIEVQMKLSGSYDGLKSFVNNLETNVRIADVQSLGIDSAIKSAGDFMEVVLTAHAYYQAK